MTRSLVVEKKLARFLAKLPSESQKNLALVQDEIQQIWIDCNAFNRMVSNCWLARITGGNDPLVSLLESGRITESDHQAIYGQVRFFQCLWGVIQIGERHIRKECQQMGEEYPFQSAFELFKEILRVWCDNKVVALSQPHYGLTVADYGKGCRLAKLYIQGDLKPEEVKGVSGSINELRSLTSPLMQFQNPWMLFALGVCEAKSATDKTLKDELNALYREVLGFCDFAESLARRKRPSKKHSKLTTCHYINGRRVPVTGHS